MKITVKPGAVTELQKINLTQDEGIRIEAIFIGSCSIYAEYNLKISRIQQQDERFTIHGIPFIVSNESQKHLYHSIYVDYNPNLGYKLSSDEEVYRYNLQLIRE
ncbi:iron-sulfur cluster biosynthesis family protein [Bacillus salitolerans]|uniref:Iron-sulfur cluster biosynthesis family protein n=1 Tax=Bacillus salitolerans TaxID=1437434 RepID=A0ABW4LVF1_9BACI